MKTTSADGERHIRITFNLNKNAADALVTVALGFVAFALAITVAVLLR